MRCQSSASTTLREPHASSPDPLPAAQRRPAHSRRAHSRLTGPPGGPSPWGRPAPPHLPPPPARRGNCGRLVPPKPPPGRFLSAHGSVRAGPASPRLTSEAPPPPAPLRGRHSPHPQRTPPVTKHARRGAVTGPLPPARSPGPACRRLRRVPSRLSAPHPARRLRGAARRAQECALQLNSGRRGGRRGARGRRAGAAAQGRAGPGRRAEPLWRGAAPGAVATARRCCDRSSAAGTGVPPAPLPSRGPAPASRERGGTRRAEPWRQRRRRPGAAGVSPPL